MNTSRGGQSNWSSISAKLAFRIGKIVKPDKDCHSYGTVSVDNVVRRLGASSTPLIPTSPVSLKGWSAVTVIPTKSDASHCHDSICCARSRFLKISNCNVWTLKSARTDRDRVKKLTVGNCRISLKTVMDGSKCRDRRSRSNFLIEWGSKCIQKSGIEKSGDQNAVKKWEFRD
jgi:hypothetical protein